MGSAALAEKRSGKRRLGPKERILHEVRKNNSIDIAVQNELARLASQNARQKLCRSRKVETDPFTETSGSGIQLLESEDKEKDLLSEREERRIALTIAKAIRSGLGGCPGPKTRKSVLRRTLDHSFVKGDLPDHILPSKSAIAYQEIVDGINAQLGQVKGSHSAAELATKHAILDASVSAHRKSSMREVSRALGIHHRNVIKAIAKRELMHSGGNFLVVLSIRRRRNDGLGEKEKEVIVRWWVSETRVSPNKKDVTRKRLSPGVFDEKATQYLQETETTFFKRFKIAHIKVLVQQRAFSGLRPFFCKRLRERNTCCCIYHVELDELRIGFNYMRAIRDNIHDCEHCEASDIQYEGLTEMWYAIVCPKGEFDERHDVKCLYGECAKCGVDKLPLCPAEVHGSDGRVVEWRRFAMEEVISKKGKVMKKLNLVYKKTSSDVFIDYLKPKLQAFVTHNFVSRWEDEHFKKSMKFFPKDTIVSVVDFAENYKFENQDEVQSQHWFSYQISILVQITFRHNPDFDPYDEDSRIITEYHFYISDDKQHDSEFVQYCFGLHWDHMKRNGYAPKQHWVWSDGCAAQFKSSRPWFFVARYPNMTNGCSMLWSFFGCGHGKGPHDGAGAVVKSFIRREQLKAHGTKLQNAADVVGYLKAFLSTRVETSYSGLRKPLERHFWHVLESEVRPLRDDPHGCDSVAGTRKIHSILATNKNHLTHLMVKNLACFCVFCIDNKWSSCINVKWTGEWQPKFLQPTDQEFVRKMMVEEWDGVSVGGGSGGEQLAVTLDIGDNFVVNASKGNDEGVDFWIIICTKQLHTVKVAFTDKWGTDFDVDDEVVAGIYYQKYHENYVLLKNSHIVYMHVHLVRCVKFLMLPKNHRVSGNDCTYELQTSELEKIMSSIATLDLGED